MDFNCPNCGGAVRIGDEYAGRPIGCPNCKRTVTAPAVQSPDNPFEAVNDWAAESNRKRAVSEAEKVKAYERAAPANRMWGALFPVAGVALVGMTFVLHDPYHQTWAWYEMSSECALALQTLGGLLGMRGLWMLVSGSPE